ncbi:MAG: endolytic transglycosylase MltG [Alistipes sp.]|nr:endolytic transglycosylase MltG [Alistipes sp.]MBR3826313.1 endolytic transglycosylase MltG [Alistipes sp.]
MKRKIIVIAIVTVAFVGILGAWGYQMFYGPAVEERVTVVLRDEESYAEMTEKVKRSIAYDWAFDFYARYLGLDGGIEPGAYTFEEGMNVIEAVRTLKFGSDNSVRLTINNARTPEILAGKIARQIEADSVAVVAALRDEALIEEMGFDSAEAMFSIFLPNSYDVYADISPEALVRRMKQESDKYWSDAERQKLLARVELTPFEVMTLASIVHEETNARDEMARVAGVYINRLRIGMPLQADPTLKYAAGDFAIKRVLDRHKEIESPYNTYMYAGLPPTPIAMPDMAAVEGVLNYEDHDYLYFCARPEMDGRHNFAKTLAEHNRNADAYHRALNRMKIR